VSAPRRDPKRRKRSPSISVALSSVILGRVAVIHQFIFAGPKPGLPAEAFQSYWMHFHAVDYAAKIPQIRQYLVSPRLRTSYPREVPFFEGVAEIWLANDADQLASLQSPEFLNGARADEPRWAAFWETLAIDTDPRTIRDYTGGSDALTKVYVLLKRSPSLKLREFQERIVEEHGGLLDGLPGIRGVVIGLARTTLYGVGEPRFDAVEVWSFDDVEAAERALASDAARPIEKSWRDLVDDRYLFTFVGREHWVIRPGDR